MDANLLPELSGETWVAATFLEEVTSDLEPAGSEPDFISASLLDNTLITVREWVQVDLAPTLSDCAGLSPENATGVHFTAGGSSQCAQEFYSAIS